jgi:Fe-Mn family superoxide dismutase
MTTTNRRQFFSLTGAGVLALSPWNETPGNTPVRPRAQAPGEHELPDLPYGYDALEPHVDEQTMRLHHQNHHGGALRGLNRTEKDLAELSASGDFSATRKLCRDLAYYGSSHIFHSIFWTNMKPLAENQTAREPGGKLAELLKRDFGSVDAFRTLFLAAANSAPASGWGVLGYHPGFGRLQVLQVEDHENRMLPGVVPLLVCDVWEHAYYLKYQNRRKEWTAVFMDQLVDWDNVAGRLAAALG